MASMHKGTLIIFNELYRQQRQSGRQTVLGRLKLLFMTVRKTAVIGRSLEVFVENNEKDGSDRVFFYRGRSKIAWC